MEQLPFSNPSAFSTPSVSSESSLTNLDAKVPHFNNPMSFSMPPQLHPSWLHHLPNGFHPPPQCPQYYPASQQSFMQEYPMPTPGYHPPPYPSLQQLTSGPPPNPCPPASQLRPTELKPQKPKRIAASPETSAEMRGKHPFSPNQKALLMARFLQGGKVGWREATVLADKTGLSPKQVKTWFANRKAKEKAEMNKMKSHTVQAGMQMQYNGAPQHGYHVERHY